MGKILQTKYLEVFHITISMYQTQTMNFGLKIEPPCYDESTETLLFKH